MDLLEPIAADLGGALIGLDFDGTLAPIVARPEDAIALPAAVDALHALAPHVRCLAVITGRPARFVVGALHLEPSSPVVVLGAYGRERWEGGEYDEPPLPADVRAALPELAELVASAGAGICLEDKGSGVAVHVRQAADPEAALLALGPQVAVVAQRHGLVVEPGRFVLELRPPGVNKGIALQSLVSQKQPTSVLFAGDDLGDLAAFDVMDALRAGGRYAVKVCSGSDEAPTLAARADLVVDGPIGIAALLTTLAGR